MRHAPVGAKKGIIKKRLYIIVFFFDEQQIKGEDKLHPLILA
jgi:hypothetical protein